MLYMSGNEDTPFQLSYLNVFFAELIASIIIVHESPVGTFLQQGLHVLFTQGVTSLNIIKMFGQLF